MMNLKACLVLSLAVLVLAVCVSADRAHVERVKGAPNARGRVESGSKGDLNPKAFSRFLNAIKTSGGRADGDCAWCINPGCPDHVCPEYGISGDCCTTFCKKFCCKHYTDGSTDGVTPCTTPSAECPSPE